MTNTITVIKTSIHELNLSIKHRISRFICLFTFLFILPNVNTAQVPAYKNAKLSIEKRVQDLLSRMTLEEKVYQMCALRLGDGDEIFKSSGNYSVAYIREQMADHGVGHISCPTTDMTESNSVKTINEIQKVAVEETS